MELKTSNGSGSESRKLTEELAMYCSAWLNVRYPASKILLLIAMPMPISCIKEMKKDEKITAVIPYHCFLFISNLYVLTNLGHLAFIHSHVAWDVL